MILHERYFDSLGNEGAADDELQSALIRNFSGLEKRHTQSAAMGKSLAGGSGQVLLSHSHRDKQLVHQWAADHICWLAGASPMIALDLYEHSYPVNYGAKAAAYVNPLVENINCQNAAQLLMNQMRRR